MKLLFPCPLLLFCLMALCLSCGSDRAATPLASDVRFDKLVILKKERILQAFSQGELVRTYKIALGFTPVGPKEIEGDGKTPEGIYFVDGKNPHSKFHKNLGVSYPSEEDTKRAAAIGKSPGSHIKIHGLGPRLRVMGGLHWKLDWTEGCIAVTDEEIDELYHHTTIGTVIDIRP